MTRKAGTRFRPRRRAFRSGRSALPRHDDGRAEADASVEVEDVRVVHAACRSRRVFCRGRGRPRCACGRSQGHVAADRAWAVGTRGCRDAHRVHQPSRASVRHDPACPRPSSPLTCARCSRTPWRDAKGRDKVPAAAPRIQVLAARRYLVTTTGVPKPTRP